MLDIYITPFVHETTKESGLKIPSDNISFSWDKHLEYLFSTERTFSSLSLQATKPITPANNNPQRTAYLLFIFIFVNIIVLFICCDYPVLLSDKGCRSVRKNCGNPPFAQIVFPDLINPFGGIKTYFHACCNSICVQIYGLFLYKHTFEEENAISNTEIFILHRSGQPLQCPTRVSNSPHPCPHSRFSSFNPCSPGTTSSLHYLFLFPSCFSIRKTS